MSKYIVIRGLHQDAQAPTRNVDMYGDVIYTDLDAAKAACNAAIEHLVLTNQYSMFTADQVRDAVTQFVRLYELHDVLSGPPHDLSVSALLDQHTRYREALDKIVSLGSIASPPIARDMAVIAYKATHA